MRGSLFRVVGGSSFGAGAAVNMEGNEENAGVWLAIVGTLYELRLLTRCRKLVLSSIIHGRE